MEQPAAIVNLTVPLDPAQHAALKMLAALAHRSMSAQIRWLIEDASLGQSREAA